jgi:hypothetical protein
MAMVALGALASSTTVTFSIYTGFGLAFSASAFAMNFALGLALNALTPKPKVSGSNRGYQVNSRGSALDHQIIYGKMRVGGAIVYDESTGTNNKLFHRVIAVAGHEVELFDKIYLNDDLVTLDSSGNVTAPSKYVKTTQTRTKVPTGPDGNDEWSYTTTTKYLVRIKTHNGSPTQAADTDLVAESQHWTSEHKLSGIAYMYVRLEHDAKAFPNGMPNITAEVKGKKVYNPATSTTAWSDNPALCLRDYLTSSYGLSEEAANIDDTLVNSAVTVCDTLVGSPAAKRYTCNGAFTTALTPYDLLSDLLTCMGGSLWYAQGKWRMKPAYWTSTVMDLDEDDFRSSVDVSTRHSRRDNFNVVKGTFRGEESNFQVTDYPQVTNSAFVSADGGQESVADLDLPFTDNSIEARRIARITLESNRQQLTINAAFGLRTLGLQVGDNVRITNTRFGWTNKEFQVLSWSFGLTDGLDLQVNMTLRETAESVYDEVDDGIVYERDNTTLLSPFEVPNLGINISTELRRVKGKTLGVLLLDINNTDNTLDTAEVQIRKSLVEFNEVNFTSVATMGAFVGTERVEVVAIEETLYDIRARATNSLGVPGEWNTISNYSVETLGAPPADVTNFSGNLVGGNLFLSWSPVPDLDLAHYIIKYSKATSGALYNSSIPLAEVPSSSSTLSMSDAGPGTYFIKAVDDTASGSNTSVNAAKFVITSVGMEELNVVATLTEHPSFSGVKASVEESNNKLLLISELFDSATGDFDDRPNNFDTITSFESSGIYYFANNLDLGFKSTCRLGYSFDSSRFSNADTFDLQAGLFESATGEFDSVGSDADDTSVILELRHTEDDPSGTPTWTDWQSFSVSDITARAFEFRALLSSTNPTSSPHISELSVQVDMPNRVESDSDITFTGTHNITFTNAFANVPAVGISLADLTDGDRYTITNKGRTGFTINTFTGSSVSTNPVTLDYVAKGYGKELT